MLWYLQHLFEAGPAGEMPFSPTRFRLLARSYSVETAAFYVCLVVWLTALFSTLLGMLRGRRVQEALVHLGAGAGWSLLLIAYVLASYWIDARHPQWVQGWGLWTPSILCLVVAGWLAGIWQAISPSTRATWLKAWCIVTVAVVTYVAVFSTLCILQYQALYVPHGDTGMYEEHLWNFLHGKGFRSQLDDGRLFLGEHFQVIHLLLAPVYALRPSLTTLYVCKSLALASGALAVCWLCRVKQLLPAAAIALSLAFLLYFPLQYLDIELGWKNFRPTTFGVPILLFAVVALESHRYRTFMFLLAMSLLVKEEYAIAVGGLGLYLMFRSERGPAGGKERWLGAAISIVAGLFLLSALQLLIPYFRGGQPHYAPYFGHLRENPSEAITQLGSWSRVRLLILMLTPLLGLSIASPLRFAVSIPFFTYLMLGDPDRHLNEPFFHFHAPLVPLLFWAAVGGARKFGTGERAVYVARLVCCTALAAGFWFGKSPLSWKFHDPLESKPRSIQGAFVTWQPLGSYWRDVYMPDKRALESFPKVFALIGTDESVAATDYIRTRFTHHRAAHDYPTFRGHVHIEDIDVIVLDQAEGWWGRGPTNPDRELLDCMNDPNCRPGHQLTVRGRPFEVIYHDEFFLAIRQRREPRKSE